MDITLHITAGPGKGKVFSFCGHDTFLVGRSKLCTFRLPSQDKFCSRIHFLVEINPPLCQVVDMGSNNGTFVNDQKVMTAELKDGDKIRAGRTILRVLVQEDEPDSALPADAAPSEVLSSTVTAPACNAEVMQQTIFTSPDPGQKQVGELPRVPGYQLLRKLGQGGMGIVYLALRSEDGLPVAIKMLVPAVTGSRNQIERFLREAEILRKLRHPHIVSLREIGQVSAELYFVMDYVPGCDARELVKERGPLPVPSAVALTCQLLDALECAHGHQFVHRDVKPSNLLVSEEGGRPVVRLADFGLARVYQASTLSGLTLLGEIGGSAGYMAPEQITRFREVLPSGDQYGAAATLYHLLTGQAPYDLPRQTSQRFMMILNQDPIHITERRSDLPASLVQIIHRALAREPKDRFADVAAFREMLEPYRDAEAAGI